MAFFDPTRPAYLANPYPALAQLRRQEPLHRSAQLNAWVATAYPECAEILRDSRRFTVDPACTEGSRATAIAAHRAKSPLGKEPTLGTTAGDAHRAIRRDVNPVFAPPAVRESLPVIESAVCALIERIPRGQPFDFMAAFANPLPRTVMCAFMGFPAGSESALREAFTTIEVTRSNARAGPPMVALAEAARDNAARALASFAPEDVPTTSVLGALMAAAARGDGLDTDRVTSVAAHIATVGADPTTGALANSLAAIAARPDLAARLRVEPALLRPAAHELLRYDSPTHIVARFAAEDSELSGRRIRRGDAVLAVVGAANRDPAVFPEPDTLDFARDARRQLAFGQGEHICLGAPLALAILEVAVRELVCAFGSIELVEPARYSGSIELRVPDRLMLRCN